MCSPWTWRGSVKILEAWYGPRAEQKKAAVYWKTDAVGRLSSCDGPYRLEQVLMCIIKCRQVYRRRGRDVFPLPEGKLRRQRLIFRKDTRIAGDLQKLWTAFSIL